MKIVITFSVETKTTDTDVIEKLIKGVITTIDNKVPYTKIESITIIP